ncbi:MAG: ABC transporter ATP-binding protein [Flavobacteriales bacterium]|nr:ABC transporter ATP-binding protein [Flavobacteriales bacterium]
MKALKSLNVYLWKYKWSILLGLFFIVLTNLFAVYTPKLIGDGVDMLKEARDLIYEPMNEAKSAALEAGEEFDRDAFLVGKTIKIPKSIQWLSDSLGLDVSVAQNINNYDTLSEALIFMAFLLAMIYIAIYLIKGVFLFFTRQTIIVMSRLIEFDLKNAIFDQYQRLSLGFYKRNNTGDLMNRISEDVSKVRMYLGPAVMYTLNLGVLIVLVVYEMVSIDLELTLYSLLPLPFMSMGIYYVSSIINKRSDAVQFQQSKLSTIVQETMSGIRVLKAYHREEYSTQNFQSESDGYKVKVLDLVKIEALFMPIIVLLVGLSTILTIYIGGMKVINGQLALGAIFQFVFYVNMLTWPFASVGWVTSLVQKAEASQARINEFLDEVPEIMNEADARSEIRGEITFDRVGFTYPESGTAALKDVSFTIRPGETLAIIGRTGSGKSTLANLISRQFEATSGQILVDGKLIREVNLSDLRSSIGAVPQEVFLFSESIKNNIAFGLDDVDQPRIEKAAKMADVHQNIVDFPLGYDTLLGERGINLSGGQKQRISIARAIIKEPKILIFDDCLSAVDTATEEVILSNLKVIMKDKTSVIISHRVSSIKHADKIIVLDQGQVIEAGTHEQLIDTKGAYFELYQKQLLEEAEA